jgi:hypothetical protein
MLNKPHNPDTKSAETTRKKIDKHLRDINDTISEEDINNIGSAPTPQNPVVTTNEATENSEKKNKTAPAEAEKDLPPEWNIL